MVARVLEINILRMSDFCHLAINRTECVDGLQEQEDPAFIELAKRVMIRDHYQCQLCDFQSREWQQVVTRNGYYGKTDLTMDNLMTVCPHCFLGQRLGYSAIGSKVTLIYLPELTQAELNNLTRLLHYYHAHPDLAEVNESGNEMLTDTEERLISCQDSAHALLLDLHNRSRLVNKIYKNAKLDRLEDVVTMLYDLPQEKYDKRSLFFESIRYMVSIDQAKAVNEYYRASVFNQLNGNEEFKHIETLLGMFEQ